MNWADHYTQAIGNERALAALMVVAWYAIYRSGDSAHQSNAAMNMHTPSSLCFLLDGAGIPAPDRIDVAVIGAA